MSSISSMGAVNPMLMERSALDGIASKEALIANLDKVVKLLIGDKLSLTDLLAVDALIIENFPFANKYTPLRQLLFFVAIDVGNCNVVRALIEEGSVDVNQMNEVEQTPLQCACNCERSDIGLVETLLLAGADVELAGSDKMTPLLLATLQGHADIVQLLVSASYKANIHHVNREGYTALHFAALGDNLATLNILLKAGSDPFAFGCHPDGCSAFHLACAGNKPLFVEKMLIFMQEKSLPHFGGIESQNLPVNYGQLPKPIPVLRNPDLKTVAINSNGGLNLAQSKLLSRSSSAFKLPLFASLRPLQNPLSSPRENSLFETEVIASPREVNKRQRIGADLTKSAQSIIRVDSVIESSPLVSVQSSFPTQTVVPADDSSESSSQASVYQSLEVRNLLDHPTSCGLTGLHIAANNGHFSVCQTLLQFGATVDLITTDGRLLTPLLGACLGNFVAIAKLLIDHKKAKSPESLESFINAVDGDGETPFSYAFWKHSDLIPYLLEHNAIIDSKKLLSQTPLEDDPQDRTALYVAVSIGIPEIVEAFLQYLKINHPKAIAKYINFSDRQGKRAIDIAKANENIPIVEMLLNYGSVISHDSFSSILETVSQEDEQQNRTALHVSVSLKINERVEEFLHYLKINDLEALAKYINATDRQGKRAMDYAVDKKNFPIVEILLKYGDALSAANFSSLLFAASEKDRRLGHTTVHKAALLGLPKLVEAFLAYVQLNYPENLNGSINTKDAEGNCPLHHAVACNHFSVAEVLLKYDATIPPELVFSVVLGRRFKWVEMLIGKSTMAVDVEDARGLTLLNNAMVGDYPVDLKILHLLLQSRFRATIDTIDQHGMNPLHRAVQSRKLSACKMLLSAGANIDSMTLEKSGLRRTSLQIAKIVNAPDIEEELLRFKKEKGPMNRQYFNCMGESDHPTFSW